MQRTAILRAYFLIPMVIASVNCFAQSTASSGQQPFVHYTPKDGLVNSRVKKAFQDSKGRMYFLTYGGLSVYDGARFKNYTTKDGLSSNVVNDILEVGDDSLLVATNSGVNINVLVKGKIGILNKTGVTHLVVNQFYRHDDDKIYLSSDDGLFLMENKNIRKMDISLVSKISPGQAPYLGNITGSGNHLVLTTNDMKSLHGLFLYDIFQNKICDALPDQFAILAGKDKQKRIWINIDQTLLVLDEAQLANGKLSLIEPPGVYKTLKEYSIINTAFDKNYMWLIHSTKNLLRTEVCRVDESGSVSAIPVPQPVTTPGLRNILIDKENTIWLSNDGEGVFKIVNSPLRIFEKPFNVQSRIDRAFYSNNVTWFNCYLGTDSYRKLYKKTSDGISELNSLSRISPIIFYADEKKVLGHDFYTVYQANISDQSKNIQFDPIITIPQVDEFTKEMIVDPNGNLILHQVGALKVWKKNRMVFEIPISKPDIIDELFIDKKNLLWVVKRYTGIDVFTIHAENTPVYLQLANHFPREQINGSPRCAVIDTNGLLWIGTRDHGLSAYKQEGKVLKLIYQFDTGTGLTDNFVTSVACDSINNIIIGTQTGLDRIVFSSGNSWRIENLSKSSNFFAFILQTWADDKHGYALTNSGAFLELSSPAVTIEKNTPQLLLEEMKVNAQQITPGTATFKYKENNLSFLVAAPSFIDERQVSYSYLLEGSGNKQWSDTSFSNAVINLTNLSAGYYTLKVKAFFPSTSYPPSELSYSFEINPPWWQVLWFRLAVVLFVIGCLIIGIRYYYGRKLEKRMALLEKQQVIEKERTRIATDMHDDLGAGLSRIKFLSETIGIKKQQQEPIEEDVNKIREYSHEMIDKMGEIVWALNEKNDSLSDLLSYTRSYAVEYLSQNGIDCKAEVPDNTPLVFVSGEFRRNVFLTIKEALHNVVKHSQATEVKLTIHINHQLSIKVEDNGAGFDKNNIRPFSNGLTNMESRVKEIGGKLEITNKNGTLLSLSIPLRS